jgi:hypothetical protein
MNRATGIPTGHFGQREKLSSGPELPVGGYVGVDAAAVRTMLEQHFEHAGSDPSLNLRARG